MNKSNNNKINKAVTKKQTGKGKKINFNSLLIDSINKYSNQPQPFEPGEKSFWDDPHISKSMLEAHLDQSHDAASRKIETIDQTVEHLFKTGLLKPGMKLLDLGCGPGLYAERLARAGIEVVGIDISQRSLEYAKASAERSKLPIEYRCINFFDLDYENEFDAVLQVYGELNTFSDENLEKLLKVIYRALKDNGVFIFDVTTRNLRMKDKLQNGWYFSHKGFWRPNEHVVLEMGFDYPDKDLWLDQYIVIDKDDTKVYRNWFHDYSLSSIETVMSGTGYQINQVWNDLTGREYSSDGDWIAVSAVKKCTDI